MKGSCQLVCLSLADRENVTRFPQMLLTMHHSHSQNEILIKMALDGDDGNKNGWGGLYALMC